MELRQLRSFVEVARAGSITRAAATLCMSQSALSRQLQELENDLGAQLFVRSTRRTTLTDAGELLLAEATDLLDSADRVEASFRDGAGQQDKTISIGAGESPAMRLIARAAVSASRRYPFLKFSVFSADGPDISERLQRGELDFGVFVGPNDVSEYDNVTLPVTDRWGLLVHRDHELADKGFVEPGDLRTVPVIAQRRAPVSRLLAGWLGYDFDELRVVATYNLLGNAVFLVEAGYGCALCIDGLADTSPQSPVRFVALEPPLEAPVYLAWRRQRTVSAVERAFLAALRDEMSAGRR